MENVEREYYHGIIKELKEKLQWWEGQMTKAQGEIDHLKYTVTYLRSELQTVRDIEIDYADRLERYQTNRLP